jgi:hypothetical protein
MLNGGQPRRRRRAASPRLATPRLSSRDLFTSSRRRRARQPAPSSRHGENTNTNL